MGFIAPFIPAIASGVGAIFGRGGGSGAREDRRRAVAGQEQMGDIFNYAFPFAKTTAETGTAATKTGMGTLGESKNYWQGILSGYRPAQMAAIAPEVKSINEMDAARRASESAYGTARGGGTSGEAAEAESRRMSQIDQALFGARPQAAQAMTQIGGAEAQIGLNQISQGLRALGLGEDAVKSIVDSAIAQREQSATLSRRTMEDIGTMISELPFEQIGGWLGL